MDTRTITLPADLADRLESLATQQGRSVADLVVEILGHYAPTDTGNWALSVAEGMETADIPWLDDPDASMNSAERFRQHLAGKYSTSGGQDE